MASDSYFFRICLAPEADKLPALWVMAAQDPFEYPLGVAFRQMAICYSRTRAKIFTQEAGIPTLEAVKRLFPSADTAGATYDEWLENSPFHFPQ